MTTMWLLSKLFKTFKKIESKIKLITVSAQ